METHHNCGQGKSVSVSGPVSVPVGVVYRNVMSLTPIRQWIRTKARYVMDFEFKLHAPGLGPKALDKISWRRLFGGTPKL